MGPPGNATADPSEPTTGATAPTGNATADPSEPTTGATAPTANATADPSEPTTGATAPTGSATADPPQPTTGARTPQPTDPRPPGGPRRRGAAYRRRLIALDVDGTILDHAGQLSPAVAAAVRDVLERGDQVVIATGRSIVATLPVATHLGITTGYAVCSNGAVMLRLDPSLAGGYEVLDAVTFDPKPALTLLREHLPTALVAVEDLGVGFKVSARFPEGELGGTQDVVGWDDLVGTPVTRVTLRMPDIDLEDFMARVERIGLHEVSYAVGWTAWLDINPEGVSKGSSLELLRRRLGVEPSDTVAVGDQRNDIEMLHWAARGVAMGQAPQQVQEAADEVTGTVEQDGLVPVLRSLL